MPKNSRSLIKLKNPGKVRTVFMMCANESCPGIEDQHNFIDTWTMSESKKLGWTLTYDIKFKDPKDVVPSMLCPGCSKQFLNKEISDE